HRAFVRELNEQMGRAYGFGGGFAVLVMVAAIGIGYYLKVLGSPALWVVTVTLGLIALFVARSRIYHHRRALRDKTRAYCETNGLAPEVLCEYYAEDEIYPFFGALFEEAPSKKTSR
ncbi:MAG: hypothetical protein ACNA8W_09960, partial [Bradymonadaceae bacterium]